MMRRIIENLHGHPLKNQKIILSSDYPCTACLQGKLIVRPSHTKFLVELSRPFPRPTKAERGGGAKLYLDSLPAFSNISGSKSYNCIKISYTKIQNKTTTVVVFTVSYTYSYESHLHI